MEWAERCVWIRFALSIELSFYRLFEEYLRETVDLEVSVLPTLMVRHQDTNC